MANILLVGSEKDRVRGIRGILRQDGHELSCLPRIAQWRDAEAEIRPELVVAAVEDTDTVLELDGNATRGFAAPLLFVQADSDFCHDLYLPHRLVDRIASPFLGEELLARVDALCRVRRVIRNGGSGEPAEATDRKRGLRDLGRAVTAALGAHVPRPDKPLAPYLEVAARLADWADRRDAFEPGHAERVTSLCAMIAESLSLGADETASLLRAAMLHDIGKVVLPVEVLHQKAPLEENQMRLIRTHPKRGAALLRALDQDDEAAATILYHHERPDGQGYYRLDGDDVPISARILALAEIYDAMTSSRLKPRMHSERALDELSEHKGETVDSDCVEALVSRLRPLPTTIPLTPAPY